jgi:hypothetical protein
MPPTIPFIVVIVPGIIISIPAITIIPGYSIGSIRGIVRIRVIARVIIGRVGHIRIRRIRIVTGCHYRTDPETEPKRVGGSGLGFNYASKKQYGKETCNHCGFLHNHLPDVLTIRDAFDPEMVQEVLGGFCISSINFFAAGVNGCLLLTMIPSCR